MSNRNTDYQDIYRHLCDDQLEGAEEYYEEEFRSQFYDAVESPLWAIDIEWAKSMLRTLFCELCEDRTDLVEICTECGLDYDTLLEIGMDRAELTALGFSNN